MAEINLAPGGAKKNIAGKKYNILALLASAALIFAITASYIFFFIKKDAAERLSAKLISEENKLEPENEMSLPAPEKSDNFKQKLAEISGLLGEHVYWSRIFPCLEEGTIPTVWYESMNVSLLNNEIALQVKAKNLDGAARQLSGFYKNKNFKDVKSQSIGGDAAGVISFSVSLVFDESLIKINKAALGGMNSASSQNLNSSENFGTGAAASSDNLIDS